VDDCVVEREFSEEEVSILGSLGLMIANTIDRHAYTKITKEERKIC
jgi:GAF domain-containing protein